jgi:putative PIN family toxin of toxin-antitoxin system
MRVLLDTNVLVRATGNASGPGREVFLRLLDPHHQLIGSAFLFDELRRVLNYPRVQALHGLAVDEAERHVRNIAAIAETIDLPGPIASTVPHDPDDDPIVATAIYGRADVLCTLDRHLHRPEVVSYCAQYNIRVLDDLALLEELRSADSS